MLRLRATVAARPEQVFDLLTEHWAEVWDTRQRLVHEGSGVAAGLGSIRAIRAAPGVEIREEVVAYDRPTLIAYRTLPDRFIADHHAVVLLTGAEDGATEIDYRMRLRTRAWLPAPLLGAVLRRTWTRHSVPTLRRLVGA